MATDQTIGPAEQWFIDHRVGWASVEEDERQTFIWAREQDAIRASLEAERDVWMREAKKQQAAADAAERIRASLVAALTELEAEYDFLSGEAHMIGCVAMDCLRCRIRALLAAARGDTP